MQPTHAPLSPRRRRLGLVALFGSTLAELSGVFMFAPLLLFTLKAEGLSDTFVGLVAASQWLGMAIATPFTAAWVQRLGLRSALLTSGAVPLVTMLAITLTPWPVLWALLSIVGGMAGALRWIVAEATVAELAPAARRGRVVGLFETLVGATFMLGPALLAWIGTSGEAAAIARWTACGLTAVGLAGTFAVPTLTTHHGSSAPVGLSGIWTALRATPALMVAGFIGGFFEAGVTSVLPLYGLAAGFSTAMAALLVSASGLGSTVAMMPVGEAADRWPLRNVLVACAMVNFLATLALPLVTGLAPLAWVIAFIWGGVGGSLYTLAMINIGHRLQGVALVNATAVLVMSYTLGGMLAPALGGAALDYWPRYGFLTLMGTIAFIGALVLLRSARLEAAAQRK